MKNSSRTTFTRRLRTTTNSSISNIYAYGIVQTLIPSIKFVPLKQDYRFVPYFSIGAGIAYSKSRYIDSSYTLSSDAMINNSSRGIKSTRALALEFGAGTKLKLTGNVALDISIKYFCYGKHMMARGVFKKINGYKLSTGVTIAF
jgi:opacity protein-like surface antigen